MADFAGQEHIVLKRVDGYQGQGIMVVGNNDIPKTLGRLLGIEGIRGNHAPLAERGWDSSMSMFQVQSCAPGAIVKHCSHEWSATTRIVWSAIIGENEQHERVLSMKAHGGFYKLPRDPLSKGITQNSTVSRSSATGLFDLVDGMLGRFTGRGVQIRATQEQLESEILTIGGDLRKIFSYADPHSMTSLARHFESSADAVRRELGREIIPRGKERERGRTPMPPAEELVPACH
jgi:hypothetical protein